MGEKYIQFAGVLSKKQKYGQKLDKYGMSAWDKQWDKGKLSTSLGERVCHCFLNSKEFIAQSFDVQHSIQFLPVVPLGVNTEVEGGKLFIRLKLSEVVDYKRMQSVIDGKRMVLSTINNYVSIRPVAENTVKQALRNRKLIKKIHEGYEKLGIKSKDGPGYLSNYDEPFLGYMQYIFDYYAKKGHIKKKPGVRLKVCPKHKRTCRFITEHNMYYCDKCKEYIQ